MAVARLAKPIAAIQAPVDSRTLSGPSIAHVLREQPSSVDVFRRLFVAPTGAGFIDGRQLPEGLPHPAQADEIAGLLIDMGLRRLLVPGSNVEQLVRLG